MIRSARADFVEQFDSDTFPYVADFANRMSELQVDVWMFTARKAACLIDAMQTVGLVRIPGVVVSDRVLDMNTEWLHGLRVALIDDVLITGSTLFKQRERLVGAGVRSVDIHVLAVDIENWQPDLAKPHEPYMEVDHRRAVNLCSQIVDALSVVPRPYNLDWPIFDHLSIARLQLTSLVQLGGWASTSTTSSLQHSMDIFTHTSVASRYVLDELAHTTGVPSELASLAKVRVYGRTVGTDQTRVSLRILPILALEDMAVPAVDNLFQEMAATRTSTFRAQFSTPVSRIRFLQFSLSIALGNIWLDHVSRVTPIKGTRHLDREQLALAFSPPAMKEIVGPIVARAQLGDLPPFAPSPLISASSAISEAREYSVQEVQELLTEPFENFYFSRELPTRELLKKHGVAAYFEDHEEQDLDRLDHGLSVAELRNVLTERGVSPQDASTFVSAFIDIAIDHGIAVPIMIEEDGIVSRAYRHGEDVVFAQVEYALFGIMLSEAARAMGRSAIPKLQVEKLCVLFLQIGLREKILNRWTGRLGAPRTVGVRWYLKGALVQGEADSLFGASNGNGVTDMLIRRGTLSITGGEYRVEVPNAAAPLTPRAALLAREVGLMFGRLLAANGRASLSKDDLILLASCPDEQSLVGALAAEVQIVSSQWPALALRLRALGSSEAGGAATQLEKSRLFEAAKSGAFKFRSFHAGRVANIVKRVAGNLDDEMTKLAWQQYWPADIGRQSNGTRGLHALARSGGAWLINSAGLVNLIIAVLHLSTSGHEDEGRRALDAARELSNAYSKLVDGRTRLSGWVQEASDWHHSRNRQLPPLLGQALHELDKLVDSSGQFLDRVRANAHPFGEPRSVVAYTSALHISITGEAGEAHTEEGRVLALIASKHSARSRVASVTMPGAPDGILVLGATKSDSLALLEVAGEAVAHAPASVGLRAVYFPALSADHEVYGAEQTSGHFGNGFVDLLLRSSEVKPLTTDAFSRLVLLVDPEGVAQHDIDLASIHLSIERRLGARLARRSDIDFESSAIKSASYEVAGNWSQVSKRENSVGILTIIPAESRAVVALLKTGRDFKKHSYLGRIMYKAYFDIGGRAVQFSTTQAIDQGASSLDAARTALIGFAAPTLISIVGIAGGIHPRLKLGDVVIAKSIIDYDPVAQTADGDKHRGRTYDTPARVVVGVNDFLMEHGEPALISSGKSGEQRGNSTFSLHFGPVGTGRAVVKDSSSADIAWLREVNEKVLAVETEARGLAHASYERVAQDGGEDYIVVRGISDHADIDKNDDWQDIASENAIKSLYAILPSLLFDGGDGQNVA